MDILIQIMIVSTGAAAIWFMARLESWRRWGFIIGLVGQPFWLYVTFTSKQWGMFTLSLWYTYTWCLGIYNYWIKED